MGYIARVKTWIAGETLTASDLNAEFDNSLDSQMPIPSGFVQGDIVFMGSSQPERLAAGTAGYFLTTHGAGEDPTWTAGMADPLTTQGDIIYYGGSGTTRLAAGTKGMALTTGGAGANPSWIGMTTQGDIEYHNGTTRTRLAAGTANYCLITNGAGQNPSWAKGAYATLTTRGDVLYYGASGLTRLAAGTEGQALLMGANDPEWGDIVDDDATAGNYIDGMWTLPQEVTVAVGSYTKVATIQITRAGTYRFVVAHAGTWYTDDVAGWSVGDLAELYAYIAAGPTSRTKIYRNGSPVGVQQQETTNNKIQYFAACVATPIVNGGLYTDLTTTAIS